MTVYSKFNIVYHLQKWMDSVPGQTFLNYAYSWGASVVILGTLFKLTHLPGANIMLFAGMGTEVFVFFLSAFDRPFDKTQDGKDLPTHIDEEEIDAEDKTAKVNTLLACVPLSQRDIVARAFGIGYDRAYEDAEIADALGYTAERIRQIKNAAIARMKTAARNKRIAM